MHAINHLTAKKT